MRTTAFWCKARVFNRIDLRNEPDRGQVTVTAIHSEYLKGEKKLWIYIPAGFTKDGDRYPLLVLFDGDRTAMWIPKIVDVLIAQGRIPPVRGFPCERPCPLDPS